MKTSRRARFLAAFLTTIGISFFTSNSSISAEPQSPVPRKSPPIIILKLDDLSQQNGKNLPSFEKMAKIIEEKHIKGSFGLICAVGWPGANPLEESNQEYLDWVKKQNASGRVEIWFHGWDHANHEVNGKSMGEFQGRTYEEQKARFDRAQKLAQEKLGFVFHTFGAGGNALDAATLQVLQDDPNMKVCFYFKPMDEDGKKLAAKGKVTLLERVVGLEKAVGVPDFEFFKSVYLKNPDREYFVLQGHPNCWDDAKFAEVNKIIDFLIAEKAVFMTPSEYAAKKKK